MIIIALKHLFQNKKLNLKNQMKFQKSLKFLISN